MLHIDGIIDDLGGLFPTSVQREHSITREGRSPVATHNESRARVDIAHGMSPQKDRK